MTSYKVQILEDTIGCYHRQYHAGEVIDYFPWPHPWRGMEEADRVENGLFVICHGQGEFDAIKGVRVDEIDTERRSGIPPT